MYFFKHKIDDLIFSYISISGLLFSIAIYMNFSSFSIRGLIGYILINLIFFVYLETSIIELSKIKIKKVQGLLLVAISCIYFLLQIINKSLFGTVTLISVFSGIELLCLLWILFNNLESNKSRLLAALTIFGLLTFLLYFWQNFGSFTPDSYSFYEISETLNFGKEYGKTNTIRQYSLISEYNISYPYFFPFCVHIIDIICLLGRYSPILFNFYLAILTVIFLLKISKKIVNRLWCGCLASFILFTNESYLGELCAGNSIPLSLFLFVLTLYELFGLEIKYSKCFVIGLIAGTLLCTRFDNILFTFFVAIVILIISKQKIRCLVFYLLGFLITMSPWIIYSIKHFNSLWISDNIGTMFLVKTEMPIHIFLPNEYVKTLFNAPLEWFESLLTKTISVIDALCCSYTADVIILLLFTIIIKEFFIKKNNDRFSFWLLILTLLFYCGKTGIYLLSGFHDGRYHVETVTVLTLILSIVIEKMNYTMNLYKSVFVAVLLIMICLYNFSGQYYGTLFKGNINEFKKVEIEPEWIENLDKRLSNYIKSKEQSIVFVGGEAYEFGGWTRRKLYPLSDSVNEERVDYLINNISSSNYVLIRKNYENQNVVDYLFGLYRYVTVDNYYLFITNV